MVADDGAILWWPPPADGAQPAAWLGAETTGLSNGCFRWEFVVEALCDKQIGVGILIAPADWGFFGYLGSGRDAFAYDPLRGAIVTETVAIHSKLPAFRDAGAGVVAVELDLVDNDECTFIVDGQRTPPVPVPPGATVIPAACLLGPGQQVRLRGFEVRRVAARPGSLSGSNERERTERFALASAAVRDRIVAQSAEGRDEARRQRLRQLLAECEDKLRTKPDDVAFLTVRAELLARMTFGSSAVDGGLVVQAFERVTAANPTDWKSWRRQAVFLGRLDRYDEQLECWDRLIAGVPGSARSLENNGQDWYPGTESDATPGRGDAYYLAMRATCLARLGRLTEALSVWHEAIARDPDNARYLVDMANLLSELGRLEEAVLVYGKVLVRSSTRWSAADRAAAHNRGLCLARLGRLDEACTDLQQMQVRGVTDTERLAVYLSYKSNGVDAARVALHALMTANPYFHPLGAWCHQARGPAMEDEYAALASSVFGEYAHRRKLLDPA